MYVCVQKARPIGRTNSDRVWRPFNGDRLTKGTILLTLAGLKRFASGCKLDDVALTCENKSDQGLIARFLAQMEAISHNSK